MSPTNLADLPSNQPAPTGLVQLKRGAVDNQVLYNNTVATGTPIQDGQGQPMRIAITPNRPGWWVIRAETIIAQGEAYWMYCYWRVGLTPTDADGFSIDLAHVYIYSALSWQETCIDTAFRLNAGVPYIATMEWHGSSGWNQYIYTGKDYHYIAGEFIEDGSL